MIEAPNYNLESDHSQLSDVLVQKIQANPEKLTTLVLDLQKKLKASSGSELLEGGNNQMSKEALLKVLSKVIFANKTGEESNLEQKQSREKYIAEILESGSLDAVENSLEPFFQSLETYSDKAEQLGFQSAELFATEQLIAKAQYKDRYPKTMSSLEEGLEEGETLVFISYKDARALGYLNAGALVFKDTYRATTGSYFVITDAALLNFGTDKEIANEMRSQFYSQKIRRAKTENVVALGEVTKRPILNGWDSQPHAQSLGINDIATLPSTKAWDLSSEIQLITHNNLVPDFFVIPNGVEDAHELRWLLKNKGEAIINGFFSDQEDLLTKEGMAQLLQALLEALTYQLPGQLLSKSEDGQLEVNRKAVVLQELESITQMVLDLDVLKEQCFSLQEKVANGPEQFKNTLGKLIDATITSLQNQLQLLSYSQDLELSLHLLPPTLYQLDSLPYLVRELQQASGYMMIGSQNVPSGFIYSPADYIKTLRFLDNQGFIGEIGQKSEFYRKKSQAVIDTLLQAKSENLLEEKEPSQALKSLNQGIEVERKMQGKYRFTEIKEQLSTALVGDIKGKLMYFDDELNYIVESHQLDSDVPWQVVLYDLLVFHQEFIKIHPFELGNGRTGRGFLALQVDRLKSQYPNLPYLDLLPQSNQIWQYIRNALYSSRDNYYTLLKTNESDKTKFIDGLIAKAGQDGLVYDTFDELISAIRQDAQL